MSTLVEDPPREGLIALPSSFEHAETLTRLETSIRANGMSVLARIDLAAFAAAASLSLRPSVVVMFGNPATHAALAQAAPSIAIDLPFKVLVCRDEDGVTWLWYNDLRWLARRHGHWRDIECLVRDLAVSLDCVARKAGTPP